ncbi:cytochrome c [Persicitalea sp.]|uniref:c-type cytochrome n=1 Tax=Persicitalea sp. TaxID=3100273 RepID=UPI0035946CBD
MSTLLKILAILTLALLLFAAFIQFAPLVKNDIPYPVVTISSDSSVLARGDYLVYGPAHCVHCHSAEQDKEAAHHGEKVALAGGRSFDLPFAKIYVPNLTPDPETGIGNIKNEAIARAMRFNTNHNGNTMIGFMTLTYMSDEDVSAVISYLRTQKPVHNPVPPSEYSFKGKFVNRYYDKPFEQTKPILSRAEIGPTVEYGEYLVHNVADCAGCHTKYSTDFFGRTYTGVRLSGGELFEEKEQIFTTPNLTPDPETGHIFNWSEEAFVARFKAGRVYESSPMPWDNFKRMTENDLRAIYKYLRTVPPHKNKIEAIVVSR